MISFDEALDMVRREVPRLPREDVPLAEALGRALPAPVHAPIDSPPFDRSAMDGFAVRSGDAARSYTIVGEVAAGGSPPRFGPGACVRIMTGAMLPPGADRVIRLEYVHEADGRVEVLREEKQDNIVRRGEGHRAGDLVLTPRILEAQDVGILASLGMARVPVSLRPVVDILTTGSELREPGEPIAGAEIYNSNGPQIYAQVLGAGGTARALGTVQDDPARIEEHVRGARVRDLLLISGGVSKGSYDFVPDVLRRAGYEVLFHHVAVRPGMPTLFARRGAERAFGLPGNTVSTFVMFEVLVRPLLRLMAGVPEETAPLRGVLAESIRRRTTDRVEFVPVVVERGSVRPVDYRGSSHLGALSAANGLLRLDTGTAGLEQGAEVDVRVVRGR